MSCGMIILCRYKLLIDHVITFTQNEEQQYSNIQRECDGIKKKNKINQNQKKILFVHNIKYVYSNNIMLLN